MKRGCAGCVVAAAIIVAVPAHAQRRPSFAGKWTLVPDRTQGGGTGGCPPGAFAPGLGQEFTAIQTSSTLTIERMQGPPRNQMLVKSTYKLDGSENTNPIPSGEAVSKATWRSRGLNISATGAFDTGGGDVAIVRVKSDQLLSLDSGGVLTVQTTLGCRDHAPETTTMVYRQ